MDAPLLDRTVLDTLLRPLVRFCVRHSFPIQELAASARRLYVQAAREELKRTQVKENASRVSVMTGLRREEVARLLAEPQTFEEPLGLTARILGRWAHAKPFATSGGDPRVLTYRGKQSEFGTLVRSVTSSVHPSAVQFELERIGAVKRTRRGLELRRRLVVLQKDLGRGFALLAADMEALIQAVEENLTGRAAPSHLHIRTEYDNLLQSRLPEIRRWLVEKGKALHREAREYLSQFDKDIALLPQDESEPAGGFVVLGAFSYTRAGPAVGQRDGNGNAE